MFRCILPRADRPRYLCRDRPAAASRAFEFCVSSLAGKMTSTAPSENWKPKDMGTVSMMLSFKDMKCAEAIKVYEKVLGAKQMFPPVTMGEPPIISHVAMKIGESTIMMHDFYEAAHHDGPSSSFVYVPDVDATCQLAKEAGFKVSEPEDMFWGDRISHTVDPFGHYWTVASLKKQPSEQEMAEGMKAMIDKYT